MRTAGELRAGIGLLVGVQMLVAFASIGLLLRMSPAIGRVLGENVRSTTAVEDMYASIARRDCGLPQVAAEEQFEDAFARARENVTIAAEAPLLEKIDATWRHSLRGDCDARDVVSESLDAIADLNREQIAAADLEAKQLGIGGAWATALLGLVSFALSAVLVRRFTQRIAGPFSEIEAVLLAVSQGDPYRRCRRLDAPAEYSLIATRLNQLLDRRLAREEDEDPQIRALDRALLQHLLDRTNEPVVAVDRSGAVVAASDRAMDVLAGSGIDSLADALAVAPDGDPETSLITRVEPFGKQQGFIVTLKPLPPDPGTEEQAKAMAMGAVLSDEAIERAIQETPGKAARRQTLSAVADRGGADPDKIVPPSGPPPAGRKDWERD